MDSRNPYEVLGVPPDASFDAIKAAYRTLSLRFHPDRATGLPAPARDAAEDRMKALNAAYAVLKDPGKRAALDRKLAKKRAAAPPPPPEVPETGPHAPFWPNPVPVAQGEPTRFAYATFYHQPPPPAPAGAVYPPYTPPTHPGATASGTWPVSREDVLRFLTFAGLTSLGWFGIILVEMSLPPLFTLLTALGFGAVLMVVLPLIKPAHKRRPFNAASLAARVLLLSSLIPVALIAVVVFPQVATDFGSAAIGLLSQMAGMTFALVVHWGVCLASYRLL